MVVLLLLQHAGPSDDLMLLVLMMLLLLLQLARLLVRPRTPPARLALVLLRPAAAAPASGPGLNHGAPVHDGVELLGGESGLKVDVRVEGVVRSDDELARVLRTPQAHKQGSFDSLVDDSFLSVVSFPRSSRNIQIHVYRSTYI